MTYVVHSKYGDVTRHDTAEGAYRSYLRMMRRYMEPTVIRITPATSDTPERVETVSLWMREDGSRWVDARTTAETREGV